MRLLWRIRHWRHMWHPACPFCMEVALRCLTPLEVAKLKDKLGWPR